jgi:hypothetical protein
MAELVRRSGALSTEARDAVSEVIDAYVELRHHISRADESQPDLVEACEKALRSMRKALQAALLLLGGAATAGPSTAVASITPAQTVPPASSPQESEGGPAKGDVPPGTMPERMLAVAREFGAGVRFDIRTVWKRIWETKAPPQLRTRHGTWDRLAHKAGQLSTDKISRDGDFATLQ